MRLLFVTLRSPIGGHSGNALILRHHLEQLSARHEIDLAAVGVAAQAEHPALRAWCRSVVMTPPPSAAARRIAQCVGVAVGRPLRVSAHANPGLRAVVAGLLASREYDALVVQLSESAQFVPAHHAVPSVLDFEDPPALKIERTRPWLPRRQALTASLDLPLMRRYESRCARTFDRLVFVSANDAQAFGTAHHCLDKVARVHHAVDVEPVTRPLERRPDGRLIVNGNMAHPPNVAAVDFVCRSVFPLIRQAIPTATLCVVGANPTPAVLAWGCVDGITITGTVDDLRAHVAEARVALCGVPVLLGAQTKVLEAMACGTPVVTTSAGIHGVDAEDGRHLFVADDPALFASRAISLLRGEGWQQMSVAGHALVRDRFSAHGAAVALEAVIAQAIDARSRRLHRTDR